MVELADHSREYLDIPAGQSKKVIGLQEMPQFQLSRRAT